jgi:hypothetical protein
MPPIPLRPAARSIRLVAVLLVALAASLAPSPAWPAGKHFETQTFAYMPPAHPPKGTRNRYVDESADLVFQQIWDHLEETGLTLVSVDPQAHVLVAQYSGDPRPYLDCGVVTTLIDGLPAEPPREFAGAKAEQRTAKTVNHRRYGLLRELDLDIRLVVRVEPRGRGARVYSDAIYVATKTLHRLRKGGVPDELVDREVVSFRSEGVGRFAKGTECVGTGKIEALPLVPFRKSS